MEPGLQPGIIGERSTVQRWGGGLRRLLITPHAEQAHPEPGDHRGDASIPSGLLADIETEPVAFIVTIREGVPDLRPDQKRYRNDLRGAAGIADPRISRLIGHDRHNSLALQQDKRTTTAWTETDRRKYAVIRERYASDLSDEEFALISSILPAPKRRGRKRTNALFYMIRRGCPSHRPSSHGNQVISSQALRHQWRD
jgi:hypothetical protein